jgi:hypothetical protein
MVGVSSGAALDVVAAPLLRGLYANVYANDDGERAMTTSP